jgi:hypothetical protein
MKVEGCCPMKSIINRQNRLTKLWETLPYGKNLEIFTSPPPNCRNVLKVGDMPSYMV